MQTGLRCIVSALALATALAAGTGACRRLPVAADPADRTLRRRWRRGRVARIIAKRVGETIGQTIVIENRGGAGSIIGTELVNKSEPTATRCCWSSRGRFRSIRRSTKKLPYDPVKDFARSA